jgi:hypothetical protein
MIDDRQDHQCQENYADGHVGRFHSDHLATENECHTNKAGDPHYYADIKRAEDSARPSKLVNRLTQSCGKTVGAA